LRTFVTVGNATQPFDRLLRAVKTITPRLPRPVLVQRGVSTVTHPDWEIHAFLPMDRFEREVAAARVLIMHAGAGSAIHALRTGRKPILMPRRA